MNEVNFSVRQDQQEMYTLGGYKVPDFEWQNTCACGTIHHWQHAAGEESSLANLDRHEEVEYNACPSNSYGEDGDEFYYCCDGWEDLKVWYTCQTCGIVVEPGYKTSYAPLIQAGQIHYYIDNQEVSKNKFEVEFKKYYGETLNIQEEN